MHKGVRLSGGSQVLGSGWHCSLHWLWTQEQKAPSCGIACCSEQSPCASPTAGSSIWRWEGGWACPTTLFWVSSALLTAVQMFSDIHISQSLSFGSVGKKTTWELVAATTHLVVLIKPRGKRIKSANRNFKGGTLWFRKLFPLSESIPVRDLPAVSPGHCALQLSPAYLWVAVQELCWGTVALPNPCTEIQRHQAFSPSLLTCLFDSSALIFLKEGNFWLSWLKRWTWIYEPCGI